MFFPFFMPICRVWGNQNVWYLSGWIALVLCNSIHTFQCSNHLFALWYLEVGLLSLWRLAVFLRRHWSPPVTESESDRWVDPKAAGVDAAILRGNVVFLFFLCYEITIKMKRKKLSVCRSSLSVGLQSGWVRYALWIYFFILNIRSEKPNNEPKLVIMNLGQPW